MSSISDVDAALAGLVAVHSRLLWRLEGHRVVVRADIETVIKEGKVTLLSGGGSGHEPAHTGYVGRGMLSTAVAGAVFVPPPPESILAALRAVKSPRGTLMIVKNYDEDVHNFRKALKQAVSEGMDVEMVIVGEDCVLPSTGKADERRGLCGTILVHKIAGALAERGDSLEKVTSAAEEVANSMVTMGARRSPDSVPGHKPNYIIGEDLPTTAPEWPNVSFGLHDNQVKVDSAPIPYQSSQTRSEPEVSTDPTTSTGCIRGVEVVGVTEFTVTTQGDCFEWEGYGLKFHVPEGSLPTGMEEARVNIRASLSGQFQLPEDSDLLSPVFWISAPCKSTKPVTLEVQHCALIENEAVLSNLSILSAQDSQRDLPYKFKQLDGGVFSKHGSYGSIQLSHFCGIAVAGKTSTPRSYCLHLYHTIKQIYDWRFYLAITQDHPALNSAVKHYYSHFAMFDTWLKVGFEGDEITLDIPEDGTIQEQQGWKITPMSTRAITRNDVNEFNKEGQWIPECELMLVWKGIDKTPIRLEYKLVMEGAKGRDYLHLVLDPAEGAAFGSREISAASRKPELKDLTDVLYYQVADQWKILGVRLEISHGSLKSIGLKYQQDPHNCLLEVLEMWLQQVDPPPTWAAVIDAVEFMGKKQLGRQLRHKCYD